MGRYERLLDRIVKYYELYQTDSGCEECPYNDVCDAVGGDCDTKIKPDLNRLYTILRKLDEMGGMK